MSAVEYTKRRAKLLAAAAWNRYVAQHGLNWQEGLNAYRLNQLQMADLRKARRGPTSASLAPS